ncbi:hypothetical protein ACQ5SO_08095 [Rhodovulum sp. DZ06]|uniref:hypothetical protein n=1 Tax=Rhodovulum sp. DZ06 TaxID=3425126 RepID=UPI003D34F8CF
MGIALILCAPALSACGVAGDAFGGYDLPETAREVPDGPWPRLADHDFPDEGPDPAAGQALIAELSIDAAAAAARAEALAGPIMTEAEAKRLRDAGRRSR